MSTSLAARVTNFIIVGAMKSGTTSLHHILASHPRIFIPAGEIGYFDHDEYFEHVDFFTDTAGRWVPRDFERNPERGANWYSRFFADAHPGQLLGEDSTTYLASRHAAARIARYNPGMRIIVMLREPAARAYSQYWHMLRTGRVFHSFEDTLRLMPERILSRSYYLEQMQRYLGCFPRSQVLVIAFEQFVGDTLAGAVAALRFLGIDASEFCLPEHGALSNPAQLARSQTLQQYRNQWLWRSEFGRYGNHLQGLSATSFSTRASLWVRALRRLSAMVNPLSVAPPPPMREDTRKFLSDMMRRETTGLSELVGIDLESIWYGKNH